MILTLQLGVDLLLLHWVARDSHKGRGSCCVVGELLLPPSAPATRDAGRDMQGADGSSLMG